jgi:hypothetical protein
MRFIVRATATRHHLHHSKTPMTLPDSNAKNTVE